MEKSNDLSYISWREKQLVYRVYGNNNAQIMGFKNGIDNHYESVPVKLQKKCRSFLRGNPEAKEKGVSALVKIVFKE